MVGRQGPLRWLALALVLFMGTAAGVVVALPSGSEAELRRSLALLAWLLPALAGGFALLAWKILDLTAGRAARRLAVDLRALAHGDDREALDAGRYAALPAVPEAAREVAAKLVAARRQVNDAVAAATAGTREEKARLAAILNDLHEGVVVCNMKHQVVLYNQVALGLLQVGGEMGLGRNLFSLVAKEPVLHILDLLLHRPRSALDNAPFVTGGSDGRSLLQGRMSLVRAGETITGYVITFNDVTDQVAALARRDSLLRQVIDGLRGPVERLNDPTHDPAEATRAVSALLDQAVRGYRGLLAGWWPMTDIHSGDLFDHVIHRLENSGLRVTLTGLPVWLHGDSHSLALALDALIRAVARGTGAEAFDLGAATGEGWGWLLLSWLGGRVSDDTLCDWQRTPVSGGLGGMTVRDVMNHHTREDLIEEAVEGRVTLRIALALGREGQDQAGGGQPALPPRPEFFDFDLLGQAVGDMGAQRLRDLTYVVFDTETTGLRPTQGDQIVSIAGVRIVNGRILTGETFSRIVDPGRPIPAESVVFHGITDDMARGKPPLTVVLPQFKAYVADAVLVAHNAAFDMKFLRLRERECGLSFDNTVLDTMLLSSYVDGTAEHQSLDAIAERYGIRVTDRHTALGDSLVTAAVLLRLIAALEDKGINTLDEAMTTLNMTMELHNRSQAFN